MRWLGIVAGVAGCGLIAGSVQAQLPTPPPVRSGYECQLKQNFLALGRYGQRPQFKDLTKPKAQPSPWPEDAASGPEIIEAQASVETDGRISRVHIAWLQSGTLGFPYSVRADLDGVVMQMDYEWRAQPGSAAGPATFDPDRIMVEIRAQQRDKITTPMALRLSRYPVDTARLGGLADIPAWQHSASITLPWPTLRSFANGSDDLMFELTALAVKPGQGLVERQVRFGRLDLTPIPTVLSQFAAMDTAIKARAAAPDGQCMKIVPEEAEI